MKHFLEWFLIRKLDTKGKILFALFLWSILDLFMDGYRVNRKNFPICRFSGRNFIVKKYFE